MSYAYGQTSERTERLRALMDNVTTLARDDSFGVTEASVLLSMIDESFPHDEGVFVTELRTLLSQSIKHGCVDEGNRESLARLAHEMEYPISSHPVQKVEGNRFVLTGDFAVEGGKETIRKMITSAGGRVTSGVSGRTTYVVVGSKGSSAWAFGNYGRKVKDALNLRLTGKSTVEVVTEEALMAFFARDEDSAMAVLQKRKERFQEQWKSAKVVAKDFEGLTSGQQKVFDLVRTGKNVYLTGLGGTGKSYVLSRIIEWAKDSKREVMVCAPTGIAALNVGGSTVHRALRIDPSRTLKINPYPYIPKDSPILECDLMIVDEISMCRLDLFDYLSSVLHKAESIRSKDGKPCCQLVVVGDFCQLPPVVPKEERSILHAKYGFDVRGGYPFMGREWQSWHFEKVELTEAIRQRDASFVAALNACRVGDTRGVQWIEEHAAKKPEKNAIVLCGTNAQANSENDKRLSALPGDSTVYVCKISGEVTTKDMPTAKRLSLKPGARVMALVNVSETSYMNGSLGTVLACQKDSVIVNFDGLGVSKVACHTWEVTLPKLIDGKIKNEVIGTFEQIPLKLAWAITIHKSQGQTFDAAVIYPRCWEEGQLYTALSRLTRIEGMYLAHPCSDSFLKTSQDVIDFMEGHFEWPLIEEPADCEVDSKAPKSDD